MREIKFRAKRAGYGNTQWVYGHFYNNCDIGSNVNYIVQFNEAEGTGDHFPIDVGTLGQFTGLHDKNGVEVYEFSLIQPPDGYFYPGRFEETMVIREWRGCFIALNTHDGYGKRSDDVERLVADETTNWCYLHELRGEFEVIGNIHQTTEVTP